MQESDVDTKIKNYWIAKERFLPDDIVRELGKGIKYFEDAVIGRPVCAAEFLHYLDLSDMKGFLNGLYKREPTYTPEAMVKAMFLIDLKKMKFYPELERYLQTYPKDAELLGFEPNKIPSDKTLWHFDNIRMGEKWDHFFRLLRNNVVITGKRVGINIGEKTIEDATPIESLHGDEKVEYNGHYEKKGYKLDTITDIDTGVPLSKRTIGINDDEAKCIVLQLDELKNEGVDVREQWIDGGYDDYPNLAWAGINNVVLHHQIHDNWVFREEGKPENIKKSYQEYWRELDFRPGASIEYMLWFLYQHSRYEEVGAYYRNMAMGEHAKNPQTYEATYHKRNRQEGCHGYWKEHMNMETRLRRKGIENVDRYLTRNLCAVLAVALCRLQHEIKRNLTSVAYLT